MKTEPNWATDPVVRLEKAVMPVLLHAQDIVFQAALSDNQRSSDRNLRPFDNALNMLRNDALKMLSKFDIRPSAAEVAPLGVAADALEDLRNQLASLSTDRQSSATTKKLLAHIKEKVTPLIEAALDCFRAVFIGQILTRQKLQAEQAASAIAGLDKISKQIFFISINASIEAARAGEAGRGFTQISMDIRALSQSAQQATHSLSNLVDQGG